MRLNDNVAGWGRLDIIFLLCWENMKESLNGDIFVGGEKVLHGYYKGRGHVSGMLGQGPVAETCGRLKKLDVQ